MQEAEQRRGEAGAGAGEWLPPSGTLGELTAASYLRAESVAHREVEIQEAALLTAVPPDFFEALSAQHNGGKVGVIAEVKRSSPSKGAIAPMLNAVAQAIAYQNGGAAAISVLTEPDRFGGSLHDLAQVTSAVKIPVLRKDFIVHPVQIWEARLHGASAVLLIVRAIEPNRLRLLAETARKAQLQVLFEVRDEAQLAVAISTGATIVGVNNRNLETLEIDPNNASRLMASIPRHIAAVAESGMNTTADAMPAVAAGADALLIGSALSATTNPRSELEKFASLTRCNR